MPLFADHDVIVHRNAEGLERFRKDLRHRKIGLRRRRIARRVIVHGNDCGGADSQSSARDLSGIDWRMINSARLMDFVREQEIPFVKKQQPELLGDLECHCST